MKRMMLAVLGAVLAASLLFPVVTEAGGSVNQNDTVIRHAD
jgi:hypothetical protein